MIEELAQIATDGAHSMPAASAVPPEKRFFVVSGRSDVRWIIPQDPSMGWPLLRQWQPYSFSGLVKWRALMVAYRAGLLGSVPGVSSIGLADEFSIVGAEKYCLNAVPLTYVGTRSRHRKLVIALINRSSRRSQAMVKKSLAGEPNRIVHEANMLSWMETQMSGAAPRLLYVDAKNGVSVQTSALGRPSGRALRPDHYAFLSRLIKKDVRIELRGLLDNFNADIAAETSVNRQHLDFLSFVADTATRGNVPASIVHGDFAPWNMLRQSDGRLIMVDWERGMKNGLPVLDLLHFHAVQAFVFHKTTLFTQAVANDLWTLCSNLHIPSDMVKPLLSLALVQEWLSARADGDYPQAEYILHILRHELGKFS